MLRLIARTMHGFWGAFLAAATLAVLVGALATAIFAGLAGIVERGLTQGFDENVLRALEASRSPWFTEVMIEITTIGSGVPLILMVALAAVLLWVTHHRWSVALLVFGSLGGTLINKALKAYFERPRPVVVDAVQQVTSLSFPSGHATSSFVVYGLLAYILGRIASDRAVRNTIWGFAAVMILLVGFSRMYLGVHYPTDVLGGFLTGLAWVAVVAAIMTALQYFASRRPETAEEEEDLEQPGEPQAT